jgi:hypothetical protein
MRELLDRHLGPGWLSRADQGATWDPVRDIPASEMWAARCAARRQLVEMIAQRGTGERLRRGDPIDYVQAVQSGFDPDRLTIGFARRLATYKRLHLVALLPERALALVGGERPVQFVFAGKAHPDDTAAKDPGHMPYVGAPSARSRDQRRHRRYAQPRRARLGPHGRKVRDHEREGHQQQEPRVAPFGAEPVAAREDRVEQPRRRRDEDAEQHEERAYDPHAFASSRGSSRSIGRNLGRVERSMRSPSAASRS